MWRVVKPSFWVLIWTFLLNSVSADVIVDNGRGHHTCDQYNKGNGITAAQLLVVVTNIAANARNAMDDQQKTIAKGDYWENFKLESLFHTFFDATNNNGQYHFRWTSVRDNLNKIAEVPEFGPREIYVFCDDAPPVFTVTDNGDKIFHDPLTNTDTNLEKSINLCSSVQPGVTMGGYRFTWPNAGSRNYIVLCLKQNPNLLGVKTPEVNDYLPDTTDYHNTFFHELSHIVVNGMRGQDTLGPDGVVIPGERWGFAGAQSVRSTYALENPDSLMLFAHALALPGDLYWHKGLGQDRYTTWLRLKPEVRQHYRLDQPPPT